MQFIGLQKKRAENSESSLIHPLSSSVSRWCNTFVLIDDPELLHYHLPKSEGFTGCVVHTIGFARCIDHESTFTVS